MPEEKEIKIYDPVSKRTLREVTLSIDENEEIMIFLLKKIYEELRKIRKTLGG